LIHSDAVDLCSSSGIEIDSFPNGEEIGMTPEPGTAVREETIEGEGGLNIFVRSWRPSGAARAVVAICPGFNSHSGHYLWVGEQLSKAGFAVYAVDLRGRGRSDGKRYYVEKLAQY
jgi:acylglycerol lipase